MRQTHFTDKEGHCHSGISSELQNQIDPQRPETAQGTPTPALTPSLTNGSPGTGGFEGRNWTRIAVLNPNCPLESSGNLQKHLATVGPKVTIIEGGAPATES